MPMFFFENFASFAGLKEGRKIFVLHLRKISLIEYICYKNIQMECGEPFYKRLHVYMVLILFHNTLIGSFVKF